MPTNFLWDAAAIAARFDIMTTELNSLASSSTTTLAISSAGGSAGVFSQSQTNGAIYSDAEFLAGGTYTPLAGGFIELWLLRSLDATSYEDGSAAIVPGRPADLIIPVRAGAAIAPRAGVSGLILPPFSWKALVRNQTGATLPASGNKVSLTAYSQQY